MSTPIASDNDRPSEFMVQPAPSGMQGAAGTRQVPQREAVATIPRPKGNMRWTIAVLLFVGVVINYYDRVNLSVAAKPLQSAFNLSPVQYGIILSSFL